MFVIPAEFHSAVAQSVFPGLLIRVLGEKHKHRNESYHKNKANKKKTTNKPHTIQQITEVHDKLQYSAAA